MALHRRAAKRDANEGEHVAEWEARGALVVNISQRGYPDSIVLQDEHMWLAETKGSKNGLTEAQVETFKQLYRAGIHVYIIRSRDDARRLLEGGLRWWTPEQGRLAGAQREERKHEPGVSRARTVAELCVTYGCSRSKMTGRNWCETHFREWASKEVARR